MGRGSVHVIKEILTIIPFLFCKVSSNKLSLGYSFHWGMHTVTNSNSLATTFIPPWWHS